MLASTVMREREGEEAWAVVRVEGKDWGRVLGVGRLGGRVIACEFFFEFFFPPTELGKGAKGRKVGADGFWWHR